MGERGEFYWGGTAALPKKDYSDEYRLRYWEDRIPDSFII